MYGCWGQGGAARRRAVLIAPAALLGALLPCALVWLWLTAARIGPAGTWLDLAGFRGAAVDAIVSGSPDASVRRAGRLLVLGLVTGLLPVVITWFLAAHRCSRQGSPELRTITPLLVFGAAGIAAGGS